LIEASDSLLVVETQEHYAKVIFTETGYYAVGFRAYMGDCYEDDLRSITVVEPDGREADNFGQSIIKRFVIYPVPNKGQFTVDVELNKISPIRLRLLYLGDGATVSDQKHSGKQEYSLPYNLPLKAGAYVMVLETPSGSMNLKMIVY
jgi:hypothetical protein